MTEKTSAYDLPTEITLTNLNYHDRRALAEQWYGDPSQFNPIVAFRGLRVKAESVDTHKPIWDKYITAAVLLKFVCDDYHAACMVGCEWATGDVGEFNDWLDEYMMAESFVRQFIELNETNVVEQRCANPGEGSYGADFYQIGDIVAGYDTEHNAWFFPAGTECGPAVENYQEEHEDSDN